MKSRNLKKFCAVITTALVLVSTAYSMEWGGVFKNDTEFDFTNYVNKDPLGKVFSQADAMYLWLNTPLTKDASIYLSAEAMYKFKYATDFEETKLVTNLADLDLLKFVGDVYVGTGTLSISAGRFSVTDATGIIFNQNSDGLSLKYSLPACEIATYAGYTRLVNANNVTMLNYDGTAFEAVSNVYSLSHPFVPLSVSVEFPTLFANQSLSVQALSFIDCGEDKKTRSYGSIIFEGPLGNIVYYNLMTSFGTVNFENAMNYSEFNLFVFPTNFMSIQAGVDYASGMNGKFSSFTGITSKTAYSSSIAPETTGVLMPKFVFSMSGAKYYVGLTGKYVLACPESKITSKGVDAALSFVYNIFNDLQLGLDAGAYIPVDENKNEANGSVTLSVDFSF